MNNGVNMSGTAEKENIYGYDIVCRRLSRPGRRGILSADADAVPYRRTRRNSRLIFDRRTTVGAQIVKWFRSHLAAIISALLLLAALQPLNLGNAYLRGGDFDRVTVGRGATVAAIARARAADGSAAASLAQAIEQLNDLPPGGELKPGQSILVPKIR